MAESSSGIGRVLKPSKFKVETQTDSRVYPDSKPDPYGQVNTIDRDRSRLGGPVNSTQLHYRSDVDASHKALHHTIGSGRNQAAPGNHQHDDMTSLKIGPMELDPAFDPNLPASSTNNQFRPAWTCANTTTDIRALLHNFLQFRDI